MQIATVAEVQARLPELLQRLSDDEEIVIVADGKPVARLLPPALPKGVPILGRGKGKMVILAEDDDHVQDFVRTPNPNGPKSSAAR